MKNGDPVWVFGTFVKEIDNNIIRVRFGSTESFVSKTRVVDAEDLTEKPYAPV